LLLLMLLLLLLLLLLLFAVAVELTYNYGVASYDIGEGFGHFGVALPDVYKAAGDIKEGGGTVSPGLGP
jgi:lactoylglutathione lyase